MERFSFSECLQALGVEGLFFVRAMRILSPVLEVLKDAFVGLDCQPNLGLQVAHVNWLAKVCAELCKPLCRSLLLLMRNSVYTSRLGRL